MFCVCLLRALLWLSLFRRESYSCGLHLWWSETYLWPWNSSEWAAFMLIRWPIWSWCIQVVLMYFKLQFAEYVKSILWCYDLHLIMKFHISYAMIMHLRSVTRRYASNCQIGSHTLNGRPNAMVFCFNSSRDFKSMYSLK